LDLTFIEVEKGVREEGAFRKIVKRIKEKCKPFRTGKKVKPGKSKQSKKRR
jgi:hypothetical protein